MDIFGQYKNRSPEEFQHLVGVSKGTYLVLFDKFVNEIAVYKDELYQVYPNPFKGRVNLRYSEAALEDGSVEIVNLLGKVVLRPELIRESMGLIKMNLNVLPEGVHFLIIKTQNGKVFKRLLKR
ncbi:MAG: hypothetical protein ACI8UX_001423 [Psychromonas sp.]|jgi:hypothetical protein